jgi:hypothetical protein
MKQRVVVVVGVAVTLALPAAAGAARRTYFGPAAGAVNNAGVELSARLRAGSATKLRRFEWHNVPAECGSAATATTGEFPKTIAVKDGKFHATATFNGGRAKVTVAGTFKHRNQRVAGTLRVRGTITGCPSADTGVVTWHAKQPAGQSRARRAAR